MGEQKDLSALAKIITAQKEQNPSADISKKEAKINEIIYKLYGLTDDEILLVDSEYKID